MQALMQAQVSRGTVQRDGQERLGEVKVSSAQGR